MAIVPYRQEPHGPGTLHYRGVAIGNAEKPAREILHDALAKREGMRFSVFHATGCFEAGDGDVDLMRPMRAIQCRISARPLTQAGLHDAQLPMLPMPRALR